LKTLLSCFQRLHKERPFELAKYLAKEGYAVYEIKGDEGTRISREIIEQKLKTL
jgi:hypothetical protein